MDYSIKIPSEIKYLSEVELFLNSLFKELHIPRKIYCKMYLSITEGINNAIIHGNKQEKEKSVSLDLQDFTDYYLFTISDEGDGFDYGYVPDPTSPKNLRKESGRGIFIMKEYADKVVFEKNGAVIKLRFNK